MKYTIVISFVCILLCGASCRHTLTNRTGGSPVVTGTITSFSALTRQKGETRMALRLTNAVVTTGECDLSLYALPVEAYGNQHQFTVQWSRAFQVAGEKGIGVRGHRCSIVLDDGTVVDVTGDWE
jgi:hypothetical protein